jgi:hypothetical protein
VVLHHIHRAAGHDIHVEFWHQLSRRNLVERPPDRRQHQIVGMHAAHELTFSMGEPGRVNTLVPDHAERALQDIDGVELADSWYDWINWKYLGYQGPEKIRPTGIRLSPTAMRAFGSRYSSRCPELWFSASPRSTPNFRSRERIPHG